MKILQHLAWLVYDHREWAHAAALFMAGLALARELEDVGPIGSLLHGLGYVALRQGNDEQAETYFAESLCVTRNGGHLVEAAMSLKALADLAQVHRDGVRAKVLLEEAASLFGAAGYTAGRAAVLGILALNAQARGDDERARALYRESLTVYQDGGWIFVFHNALVGLAALAVQQGEATPAACLFGAGEARCTTQNIQLDAAERARYDHIKAEIRLQLDPDTFATAWRDGQAMTVQQAIAYALDVASAPAVALLAWAA